MIGMVQVRADFFNASPTRWPCMAGIMMSRMIKSGFSLWAVLTPCIPSKATKTSYPAASNLSWTTRTKLGSSSTTKILFLSILSSLSSSFPSYLIPPKPFGNLVDELHLILSIIRIRDDAQEELYILWPTLLLHLSLYLLPNPLLDGLGVFLCRIHQYRYDKFTIFISGDYITLSTQGPRDEPLNLPQDLKNLFPRMPSFNLFEILHTSNNQRQRTVLLRCLSKAVGQVF